MKTKMLKKLVQKKVNGELAKHSKYFTSEVMNNQIEALIEVIAPLLSEKGEPNDHKRKTPA